MVLVQKDITSSINWKIVGPTVEAIRPLDIETNAIVFI